MKPYILDNLIDSKELFFIYKEITSSSLWSITATPYSSDNHFFRCPQFFVKTDEGINNYPFYLYGQTLIYRINQLLNSKNIGIPTKLERMWFNLTYNDSKINNLHPDTLDSNIKTILIFMTPIWQQDWKGSFVLDGQEIEFKPGRAIIFDSTEYHAGQNPKLNTSGWQRITLNLNVKME